MPHASTILPADRFFARLDKFECECPSCSHIVATSQDHRKTPLRLGQQRGAARGRPRSTSIWSLTWNPLSQRLKCPNCSTVYIAGLLLYPTKWGRRRVTEPPPDTVPTRRQLSEMRRMTGGWWAEEGYAQGEPVNLVIDSPCCCPAKGWAPDCPIHGDPAYRERHQPKEEAAEE